MIGWLDASAGVSGDMLLGAMVDAGADLGAVQLAVDAVLPSTVRLHAREVRRAGMRATKVDVELLAPDQPHRSWRQVRTLLDDAGLAEPVRDRAIAAFTALAEAEAAVHGTAVDDAGFHEVGGWDSIADVVGAGAAAVALGLDQVVVGPIELGSGHVATAHGRMPVPGPAVLRLLAGWSVTGALPDECTTPTGAAVVRAIATQGEFPAMVIDRTGVGAGGRDPSGHANVTRLVLGRSGVESGASTSSMRLLEATIDDLDPRLWPGVIAGLLEVGAADAWVTPTLMKKGRPAHVLSVLGSDAATPALREYVLTRTSTLGVRESTVRRHQLDRCWAAVVVDGVAVAVKVGHRGGEIVHVAPEFDDVAAAAAALGRPVMDVLRAAEAAADAAGLTRGRALPASARPQRGQ